MGYRAVNNRIFINGEEYNLFFCINDKTLKHKNLTNIDITKMYKYNIVDVLEIPDSASSNTSSTTASSTTGSSASTGGKILRPLRRFAMPKYIYEGRYPPTGSGGGGGR